MAPKKKTEAPEESSSVTPIDVPAPNIKTAVLDVVGTSQYVSNRFPKKAMEQMLEKMRAGETAIRKKREPRDEARLFRESLHTTKDKWHGIPCTAFKAAMVDATALVQAKIKKMSKISFFVEPDGFDAIDGTPLVKINGKPEPFTMPVRVGMGQTDLRTRARFPEWKATVRIKYDADIFPNPSAIVNLLMRAGAQVGVGEGRNGSKMGVGMGWGSFDVKPILSISRSKKD